MPDVPSASDSNLTVGATDTAPDASAARISRADVAHLARLARLAVTEDELEVFAGQLDVILGAVARVREVAAEDIPPTSHAVPMTNVFRPDENWESLPRDAVLASAPAVEENKFRVPRILAEEA
ncbi:MAG: aspartyl-tRNA(Asn)/glutamyl-tRNA(Gln) amidotransferase subunit [Pseudonocardiales bacterium]|nr:aspartyl-tRNA(Asn)/glutamyl-tRNA(Gln) amidotransferase subunit [Pseudonocardiales bacterium]